MEGEKGEGGEESDKREMNSDSVSYGGDRKAVGGLINPITHEAVNVPILPPRTQKINPTLTQAAPVNDSNNKPRTRPLRLKSPPRLHRHGPRHQHRAARDGHPVLWSEGRARWWGWGGGVCEAAGEDVGVFGGAVSGVRLRMRLVGTFGSGGLDGLGVGWGGGLLIGGMVFGEVLGVVGREWRG